jgi:predicted DNA-binding transcriptional regulator AlpA
MKTTKKPPAAQVELAEKAAAMVAANSGASPYEPPVKLLTREQVLAMLGGLTYPSLFGWIRDGLFPPGIELGAVSGKGRVVWLEHEVLKWIADRPRRLLKGRKSVKEEA